MQSHYNGRGAAMTLNLNDLMIFLESQFIQEQHAQAVSFRLLNYWLL